MNKSEIKQGLIVTVAVAGAVGSAAGQYVIHEQDKKIKQYKFYVKYLKKINEGLEDIAMNPKVDPMENREAVSELYARLKDEAVLEGLDFHAKIEGFNE